MRVTIFERPKNEDYSSLGVYIGVPVFLETLNPKPSKRALLLPADEMARRISARVD